MSLDTDGLIDRRRLRRKLTFWRVLTFVVLVGVVLFATLRFAGDFNLLPSDEIARVMMERLGEGQVHSVEEPVYAGANGALKIAHDMPAEYWEKLR